eukprot:550697-Pyramimonas_sp.AAC.1
MTPTVPILRQGWAAGSGWSPPGLRPWLGPPRHLELEAGSLSTAPMLCCTSSTSGWSCSSRSMSRHST